MKYLLLFIVLFPGALPGAAQVSYGNAFADSLMRMYNSLDDGSYKNRYARLPEGGDSVEVYAVPIIFGADAVGLYKTENGIYYRIQFLKTNKEAKSAGKNIQKAFKKIAGTNGLALINTEENHNLINLNGNEIMSFWMPNMNLYDEYIFIDVQKEAPRKPVLADESSYKGVYPTQIQPTDQPQIVFKKENTGACQIWNGIFKNNVFVKGRRTFTGYSAFYDGTWYSDEWFYGKDNRSTDVIFCPANSADSIFGHLNDNSFEEFYPDSRYEDKKHASSFAKNAPLWLRTTFEDHQMAVYEKKKANNGMTDEQVAAAAAAEAALTPADAQQRVIILIDNFNTAVFKYSEAVDAFSFGASGKHGQLLKENADFAKNSVRFNYAALKNYLFRHMRLFSADEQAMINKVLAKAPAGL